MKEYFSKFFKNEASSGIILVFAAAIALILANSPLNQYYTAFLELPISVMIDEFVIAKPMVLWINDGLMALFFFVVGLEIKREIFYGQLSNPSQLLLPLLAAIAGIAFPALIYLWFNSSNEIAASGWAIPSATDIAFALGVFILFGKHLPPSLKLFLLSVAIMDDIAAVLIIALFYSQELSTLSLMIAAFGLAALFALNRFKVISKTPYIIIAVIVWAAVLKSGVHATLAGFAVALFIPMERKASQSMSHHMEHSLHPWISFLVLPAFAFANAGVSLIGTSTNEVFTSISIGIAAGLLLGKQLGIFGICWVAVKLKICQLPKDVTWLQIYGVSLLCGIGFTMSLFIGSLAFEEQGLSYLTQVKVGVLVGSLISAILGTLVIKKASALIGKHKESLAQQKGESHENQVAKHAV